MELVEGFAEKLQALSFDSNSNLPNSESHLYKVMKNIFLVVYTPFGDYVDDEIHSHITGYLNTSFFISRSCFNLLTIFQPGNEVRW